MPTLFKSKKAMLLGAVIIFTLGNVSGVSASTTLKEITAYLDSGMRLVVDGLPFTAKDSDGKILPPINYEGNTYLPLRSVAEVTGMSVKWDDATRTATLGAMWNQESESHEEVSLDRTFKITLPGTWTRNDKGINKINPEIDYGAINTKLDTPIFMGVISESKSTYIETMKLDGYQKIIIDQMKSNDSITDFKVTSEEELTVNGFSAKQTEIHSVINKSINAAYQITFIETKDRFYQVIFWTTAKQMSSSKGDLSKIASSFREIE